MILFKSFVMMYLSAWKEVFPFIMIYFCGRMIIRLSELIELFFNNTLSIESSWAMAILIAIVFPILGKGIQTLKKNYPEMISFLLGGGIRKK